MAKAVRAIVIFTLTIFAASMMLLIGSASVGPVGDTVNETGTNLDTVNGGDVINSVHKAVFQWAPMILIGGMMAFGVALILFREQFTGRRRPPGGGL